MLNMQYEYWIKQQGKYFNLNSVLQEKDEEWKARDDCIKRKNITERGYCRQKYKKIVVMKEECRRIAG